MFSKKSLISKLDSYLLSRILYVSDNIIIFEFL